MKKIAIFLLSCVCMFNTVYAMQELAIPHKDAFLGRTTQSNRLARYFPEEKKVEEEKKEQNNSSVEHKVDNTDGLENNEELTSNMELMAGYVLLHEYHDEDFINTTEKLCKNICPLDEKPVSRNHRNKFEAIGEAHNTAVDVAGFFDEEYLKSLE